VDGTPSGQTVDLEAHHLAGADHLLPAFQRGVGIEKSLNSPVQQVEDTFGIGRGARRTQRRVSGNDNPGFALDGAEPGCAEHAFSTPRRLIDKR